MHGTLTDRERGEREDTQGKRKGKKGEERNEKEEGGNGDIKRETGRTMVKDEYPEPLRTYSTLHQCMVSLCTPPPPSLMASTRHKEWLFMEACCHTRVIHTPCVCTDSVFGFDRWLIKQIQGGATGPVHTENITREGWELTYKSYSLPDHPPLRSKKTKTKERRDEYI